MCLHLNIASIQKGQQILKLVHEGIAGARLNKTNILQEYHKNVFILNIIVIKLIIIKTIFYILNLHSGIIIKQSYSLS